MQQPIEFRKTREFGEIVSDTFLFIKQNFKPLMKAYIFLCGLFIVGGMLSYFVANLQLVGLMDAEKAAELDSPVRMLFNFGFNYFMILVFYALSYTSFFACILSYIALYIRKGNVAPSLPEVWSYFKFYFFRVFGGGFIVSCFWMICFMLCLLPGIWVTPPMSIFFCVMIMENSGIGYAFNRSFKLVTNEWWITFAVIVVIYIIFQAGAMFVQIPALVIAWGSAFTDVQAPFSVLNAVIVSLSQYLSQVLMIIPIVASALTYFNLVERKESTGLLEKIEAFGERKIENIKVEEY